MTRFIDFFILLIPILVLALFCSSIPTSLFILKSFFVLVHVILCNICSRNIRDGSKIEITLTISTDTSTTSPETSTCGNLPSDISRKLRVDFVYDNSIVEVNLLHVLW